jgi:hypothetical protein
LLKIAPVLRTENPHKEFVVCTYASKEGIGGVLMPDDNVISYES